MASYREPETFAAVLTAIEQSIRRQMEAELTISVASANIVGVTLANNSMEIRNYFEHFPELVDLTELAADLEWQAEDYSSEGATITKEEHDQWVQECWQKLKDAFETIKARYNDNGLSDK